MPVARVRKKQGRKVTFRGSSRPLRSFPAIVFPADLAEPDAAPGHVEDNLLLSVYGTARNAQIQIRLTRRDQQRWWGTSDDGTFTVEWRRRGPHWTLAARVTADPLHAGQAEHVLQLIDALRSADAITLMTADDAPAVAGEVSGHIPTPPPGLAAVITALAKLERHLGQPLVVPEVFDPDDAAEILLAGELLRGGEVDEPWQPWRLRLHHDYAEQWRHAPWATQPTRLTVTQSLPVHLADQVHVLDPITVIYHQVQPPDWTTADRDGDWFSIDVHPGADDTATLRFGSGEFRIDPAMPRNPDPDAAAAAVRAGLDLLASGQLHPWNRREREQAWQ